MPPMVRVVAAMGMAGRYQASFRTENIGMESESRGNCRRFFRDFVWERQVGVTDGAVKRDAAFRSDFYRQASVPYE